MLTRVDWPNRQGFDFEDANGNTVLSVWDKAGDHRLNLQSIGKTGYGEKYFSLDRTCELGMDLHPAKMDGEALLSLVNTHGAECA